MRKRIAVSGYFLWLHVGHIEYFRLAAEMGDLYVILNNDIQQVMKYGKVIVPMEERAEVIKSIKYVKQVLKSADKNGSVCKTLEILKPDIFCNGGDRTSDNIPEIETCERYGIQMAFGLGEKKQSASELINKVKKYV